MQDSVLALMRHGEVALAAAIGRLLDEPEIRSLHLYRSPDVSALADEIFDCDSIETLHGLLKRVAAVFDVSHCTVHCVQERQGARYQTRVVTTYPNAWVREYVDRRYSTVDPIIARSLLSSGVFFWDEIEVADPIRTHFLRAASAHGIGPSGVTLVAENAQGDTFAVSLAATSDGPGLRRAFAAQMSDYVDIATLLIEVFSDIACERPQADCRLTDDQMKVLRALAAGKTTAEIEQMHFTFGSFATLEKSILMCLNAKTLTLAAALAVGQGIFDSLPYFEEDIFVAEP